MSKDNELERLEGFVATLLEKFNTLQSKYVMLTERLGRRDESIETLQAELDSMREERGDISSRVSSLIGKIEEWESESEIPVAEDESNDDEKSFDSSVQGNLFSADDQGES